MSVTAPVSCTVRFIGEVIQTSRGAEQCFAKLSIREICIEIPHIDCDAVQLGDVLAFETELAVPAVQPLTTLHSHCMESE